jgi:hypothetical protein
LPIFKIGLTSLRRTLPKGVALWIWDNGSGEEARAFLASLQPDALFLSPNVGKPTARRNLLGIAPFGSTVAMADDDILYFPGWWEASEQVLRTYPNVGVVTGYPCRTSGRWAEGATIAWASKHAEMREGRFLPWEWEREFAISIGRDPDAHRDGSAHDQEYCITYGGVTTYALGHHCQWMGYRERILPLVTSSSMYMADERTGFDVPIDNAGLLRLATEQRYTRHAGNCMDDTIREFAAQHGIEV